MSIRKKRDVGNASIKGLFLGNIYVRTTFSRLVSDMERVPICLILYKLFDKCLVMLFMKRAYWKQSIIFVAKLTIRIEDVDGAGIATLFILNMKIFCVRS